METFRGSWAFNGDIENLDNFLAAIELTDKRELFTSPYEYEVTTTGNSITYTTKVKGQPPYTNTAVLGQKNKFEMPERGLVEAVSSLEGNVLVVHQDISGLKQVMRSHVENGKLIVKTTAKGVTMTAILHKV